MPKNELSRSRDCSDSIANLPDPPGPAMNALLQRSSTHDGGQLAFLLMTESGSILVSGSAGYWRGIYKKLRPDVQRYCPLQDVQIWMGIPTRGRWHSFLSSR